MTPRLRSRDHVKFVGLKLWILSTYMAGTTMQCTLPRHHKDRTLHTRTVKSIFPGATARQVDGM
jgi:hypothetical protein